MTHSHEKQTAPLYHLLVNMKGTLSVSGEPNTALLAGLGHIQEKYNALAIHLMFDGDSSPYRDPAARAELIDSYIAPAHLSTETIFADGVFRIAADEAPLQINTAPACDYSLAMGEKKIYGSKAEAYKKLAYLWKVSFEDMGFVDNNKAFREVPTRLGIRSFRANETEKIEKTVSNRLEAIKNGHVKASHFMF